VIRLAVFGKPVTHSLSPRIHGLFADQCGLEIDYRAIEATQDSFPDLLGDLAARGGRGCNITVPLKHDAWALAARCSDNAKLAQAANTLVFNGADDCYADNTDGQGLVNDLESFPGRQIRSARICLMGAGGAAAGVLGALLQAGPESIVIVNRTLEKAVALARSHSKFGALESCTPGGIQSGTLFDLVINATSLGHAGRFPEISRSWLKQNGLCYDMNYGEAAKPLMRLCQQSGISYSDGLGMLVNQAALSFRLWTGIMPETTPVLKLLRKI